MVFHVTPNNWEKYLDVMNNWVHIMIMPLITYIVLVIVVLALKKIKFVAKILP